MELCFPPAALWKAPVPIQNIYTVTESDAEVQMLWEITVFAFKLPGHPFSSAENKKTVPLSPLPL